MIKILSLFKNSFFIFVFFFITGCGPKKEEKKICITQIVEHPALNKTRAGFVAALKNQKIKFYYQSAHANHTIASQITQRFLSLSPDIYVALSTPSLQSFLQNIHLIQSPILFGAITYPDHMALPKNKVTGVTDYVPIKAHMHYLRDIFPDIQIIGTLYNPGEINAHHQIKALKAYLRPYNIQLIEKHILKTIDIAAAMESLSGKVQALYLPTDNIIAAGIHIIMEMAHHHKIPVSVEDTELVALGGLFAYGINRFQAGHQLGEMAIKLLNGESIGHLAFENPTSLELILNQKIANYLDITFPDFLLKKADKIMVMEAGTIVEMGTHAELLAKENGHYRNLYEVQFLKERELSE